MSSPPLNNFPQTQMQIVGNNSVDHSPDLRFCAVPGVGQPATSAQGLIRAQNNYHINITNQPGAIIDVGKIQDMVPPAQNASPALLPFNPCSGDPRRSLGRKRNSPPAPILR